MKRILLAAVALGVLTIPAAAQSVSRSFYDNRGSFAGGRAEIVWNGQSWTRVIYHGYMGNTTSFSDGRGRFSGSAIRHGNSTSFYDGRGRYSGSSINTSPRR
jgi:opacity protein-like surface antigen